MSQLLKYVPVLRVRQEEIKVLKSFDFGKRIYPCLEITKELVRESNEGNAKNSTKPKVQKTFEDDYLPLINSINAEQVFVDLPVHLKPIRTMKDPTILFLKSVVANREVRTAYIKKLIPLATKVIPVISTYLEMTGERSSITLQENDLRPYFKTIAFRTFFNTFPRDIQQIRKLIQKDDYVIMDWEDMELDVSDGDQQDIVDDLKKLDCNIIVHRNPFPKNITNAGIEHGMIVETIDNGLMNIYEEFAGKIFSDYVGIKKDNLGGGPITSPGFFYYDAIKNVFYGYRYKYGSHKKGQQKPRIDEYETTIIPAVINSEATRRMRTHPIDFLGGDNNGWRIIKNIELGVPNGESGKSAAKFKRISMEHYLYCIRTRVSNGDFD